MAQVFCLLGPTASGKTDLAAQLLEYYPQLELISVDSALVYRELTIGAAKPNEEELAKTPTHLIDVRSISEPYSAADFVTDVTVLIKDIISRGRQPLLVGGTMLYFKALQQGLADLPAADEAVRQKLLDEAERLGWAALHNRLQQIDPESAQRIHPNDPQRLQRALEVYETTGKPLSEHFNQQSEAQSDWQFINLGLLPEDRAWLHNRIAQRLEKMFAAGFVDEVRALYERGDLSPDLPALRSVGYRQVWQYLANEIDEVAMREKALAATRQLAKRQITWLRSWPGLIALQPEKDDLITSIVKTITPFF